MFEINVKIQHNCPYLDIANIFDEPTYGFCSQIFDLFIIPREITIEELARIKEYIIDIDSLEILSAGDITDTTYLYFRCMCGSETSISPKIQKHGGIVQEPIVYQDGWEWYKIINLNEKTQANVLKYLQTIPKQEIISIRDLGRDGIFKTQFVSVHQMTNMMTDRQIEVLVEAYQNGYYEIPRNTTTQDLADHFEVSRPATEKSLRKAENSVMKMVMPYLIFHNRIHSKQDHGKINHVKVYK